QRQTEVRPRPDRRVVGKCPGLPTGNRTGIGSPHAGRGVLGRCLHTLGPGRDASQPRFGTSLARWAAGEANGLWTGTVGGEGQADGHGRAAGHARRHGPRAGGRLAEMAVGCWAKYREETAHPFDQGEPAEGAYAVPRRLDPVLRGP